MSDAPHAAAPAGLKVLLLENVHASAHELLREAGCEVEGVAGALSEEELIARVQGVHVLGIRSKTQVTASVLADAPTVFMAYDVLERDGVDVRVLVPGRSDLPWVSFFSRAGFVGLLNAGVHIYEWDGPMLHAKTAVIDGVVSTVGSSNMDWRSLVQNSEVNAMVYGEAFGDAMTRMFRADVAASAAITLAAWRDASVDTRTLICHWHLQLTDPLYRAFTGEFLPARFARGRLDLHRATVDDWVAEHGLPRWAIKTRTQFASRLLACARAAGLLRGRRDPLELAVPRVPDDALTYLLYLLRDVDFAGTLVDNPYLASLHLDPATVADRTRALPALTLRRLADVLDLDWRYPDLFTWATARTSQPGARP